jgi:hypothetical protein
LNFKGTPSQEEHKTGFTFFTTTELNLLADFTKSCNNDLRTMILEILLIPAASSHQPGLLNSINAPNDFPLYNHTMVQVPLPYCLQLAQAGLVKSQILARSS